MADNATSQMTDCLGYRRWSATSCRRCGYERADCTCVGGFVAPETAKVGIASKSRICLRCGDSHWRDDILCENCHNQHVRAQMVKSETTSGGDVKSVFLFNNMLAVCDHDGQPIPELQGEFSYELLAAILLRTDERTEWHGVRP